MSAEPGIRPKRCQVWPKQDQKFIYITENSFRPHQQGPLVPGVRSPSILLTALPHPLPLSGFSNHQCPWFCSCPLTFLLFCSVSSAVRTFQQLPVMPGLCPHSKALQSPPSQASCCRLPATRPCRLPLQGTPMAQSLRQGRLTPPFLRSSRLASCLHSVSFHTPLLGKDFLVTPQATPHPRISAHPTVLSTPKGEALLTSLVDTLPEQESVHTCAGREWGLGWPRTEDSRV